MHKITLLTQQVTVPSTQLCLGNPVCAHSYSALISVPRTTVPGAGPSPSTQCLGSDCKCTVRFPLHLGVHRDKPETGQVLISQTYFLLYL